jgi:hypothetical protein
LISGAEFVEMFVGISPITTIRSISNLGPAKVVLAFLWLRRGALLRR